jgi:hypothetical protein
MKVTAPHRALRFEAGMPALRRIEANTARRKTCNTSLIYALAKESLWSVYPHDETL